MDADATRRRVVVAGLLAVLASCATLPRSIEISRQQIESALARRFPYRVPAGELLMVQVGQPRVDLLSDANRIRLDSPFEVSERITHRAMRGAIALSFAVRFEPSDASFRLVDVLVERVDVQGVPEDWRRPVEAIAAYVGEHLLEGYAVRTFTHAQFERAKGLRPGAVRVTSSGVSIELLPP